MYYQIKPPSLYDFNVSRIPGLHVEEEIVATGNFWENIFASPSKSCKGNPKPRARNLHESSALSPVLSETSIFDVTQGELAN